MTETPAAPALPAATRVGRLSLVAGDRSALVDFYRDVVGLSVRSEAASATTLGAGGTPLLVLTEDDEAPPRPADATGLYHVAFRFPSRAALGDAARRVRERWRLDGASDHGTSEALYLADPEGNGVELYRDRPREAWPVADGGRVAFARDRLDLAGLEADAAGGDAAPPGTDVGHVHLEVSDLHVFREFYVDALGFEVQAAEGSATFVSAGGYHHHVAGNTWRGRTRPPTGRGLAWVEFVVPDADVVDAVRERLAARSTEVRSVDPRAQVGDGGPSGIELVDSDGIRLRLRVER